MKFVTLFLLFVLSNCSIHRHSKFPPYIPKETVKELKKMNTSLVVLERWDALTINMLSPLYLYTDSIYSIKKDFFYNHRYYHINDWPNDQQILKKYLNLEMKVNDGILRYYHDCDHYIIYKFYLDSSNQIIKDTLYRGSFP